MSENEQCLQALEAEASGDWEKAHRLVQDGDSPASAWVHAYLHRVEGDVGNAGFGSHFPTLCLSSGRVPYRLMLCPSWKILRPTTKRC